MRGSSRRAVLLAVLCIGFFPARPAGATTGVVLGPGKVLDASLDAASTTPADGRLRGRDSDAVVTGVAWPRAAHVDGTTAVAGAGDRLVVFTVSLAEPEADVDALTPTHGTPAVLSLGIATSSEAVPMSTLDTEIRAAPYGQTGHGSATFVAAVPDKSARHVSLVLTQDGDTERFDLWTLERLGPDPGVLYRAETGEFAVTATTTGSATLPVTAPTGAALPVHISVTSAALSAFPPPGTVATTSSITPTDADLDVELLGTDLDDPASGDATAPGWVTFPTPLPASRLTFTPTGGQPVTATEFTVVARDGEHDTGLFDAWYEFVVPDHTTAGTFAIAPGPATGEVCALVGCSATAPIALGAANLSVHFPAPPPPPPAQGTPPWVGRPDPPTGKSALDESTKTTAPHDSPGPGPGPAMGGGGLPIWIAVVVLGLVAVAGTLVGRRRARWHRSLATTGIAPDTGEDAATDASEQPVVHPTSPSVDQVGDVAEPARRAPVPVCSPSLDVVCAVQPPAPVPVLGAAGDVVVRVLGRVTATGWTPPTERATVLLSTLCYLALHAERPRSSEEIAASLGGDVTEKTARNNLSRLRQAVGEAHLPDAALAAGYQLQGVVSDWGRFCELVAAAHGADGARHDELLAEALAHVRGRPFEGAHAGAFHWVEEENLDHQMTAQIVRVAHELSEMRLARGDAAGARSAEATGLLVAVNDVSCWRDFFAAARAAGERDAVTRHRAEAARLFGPAVADALAEGRTPFVD